MRTEELLNNCIAYLSELKEHESNDEKLNFWMNIIGMTPEELKRFEVDVVYPEVNKIRDIIYDYVYEEFGESEARSPSWYIPTLAEEIASKINDENYKPVHLYEEEN